MDEKDHATEDGLLDTAEAARVLGISPATLNTWRSRRLGPRWVAVSARAVRYQRRALDEFIERQTRGGGR